MIQDEFEITTPMETEGESEEVSINLSYPFEYSTTSMTQHVKPLYINAFFDGIQMNQVLVDNGGSSKPASEIFFEETRKKEPQINPNQHNHCWFCWR